MSIPIMIAVMTCPLVMYTIGLIKSRRYNIISAICYLGAGLIFDYYGTYQMYLKAGRIIYEFHPILGIIAVSTVTIEFGYGFIGVSTHNEKMTLCFRKVIPYVYTLWLISFSNGVVAHVL